MEQLYIEYENSIAIQKKVIAETAEKLKRARSDYNHKEIKRLNALMKLLYEEKWELEERSRGIKNYLGVT